MKSDIQIQYRPKHSTLEFDAFHSPNPTTRLPRSSQQSKPKYTVIATYATRIDLCRGNLCRDEDQRMCKATAISVSLLNLLDNGVPGWKPEFSVLYFAETDNRATLLTLQLIFPK